MDRKERGGRVNTVIFGRISQAELVLSDTELSARLMRTVKFSDDEIKSVSDEILGAANMRFAATKLKILGIDGDVVKLEGFSVTSSALAAYLSGREEAYIFVATLGSEVDRLIMKKRVKSAADAFIFDAVASALTEALCDAAEKKIHPKEKTKPRFSPGYADCPLSVQKDILNLLSADKYTGVKLLDSLLMSPMKSVSAFVAILS